MTVIDPAVTLQVSENDKVFGTLQVVKLTPSRAKCFRS